MVVSFCVGPLGEWQVLSTHEPSLQSQIHLVGWADGQTSDPSHSLATTVYLNSFKTLYSLSSMGLCEYGSVGPRFLTAGCCQLRHPHTSAPRSPCQKSKHFHFKRHQQGCREMSPWVVHTTHNSHFRGSDAL